MTEIPGNNGQSNEYAGVPLVVTSGVQFTDRRDPDGRLQIALENAERCRDAGVPFVVADTSHLQSGETWVADAFTERSAVVLSATKDQAGIARQRQLAAGYVLVHGAEGIASYEADKIEVVDHKERIIAELMEYDALAIGRTPESLHTLPPVQQRTEEAGGHLFRRILGIPPDSWSGVRAFTARGVRGLLDHPTDTPVGNSWTWLYGSLIRDQDAGMPVGGFDLPFKYPKAMTDFEIGNENQDNKRAVQFILQARWAAEQVRVDTIDGARELSNFVMEQLVEMPEDLQAIRYTHFAAEALPRIEDYMAANYGFQPVGR